MKRITMTSNRTCTARTKPGKTAEVTMRRAVVRIEIAGPTKVEFLDGVSRDMEAGDILEFRFEGTRFEVLNGSE